MLAGLCYSCKKIIFEENTSPLATCEFTAKGNNDEALLPHTILYFYDNESNYIAAKSGKTGLLNTVMVDSTDDYGKLTVKLPSNKQYWVRGVLKVKLNHFNNFLHYYDNDDLNNSSLVLIPNKNQKASYTLKVDNENPYSLIVVYSSDASLLKAKVQLKNKLTNKVISKTFGNKLKDTISQFSSVKPQLSATLDDAKNCVFYLVKKGAYRIKTLSTNGLITSQDIEVKGGGNIEYFDIKGKEIATASSGIKLTFFCTNSNLDAYPYRISINGDSVGYLKESTTTSSVLCNSSNLANIFTVIIPKASANNYIYSFAFQSSIPNSAPFNTSFQINSSSSCQKVEVK